MKRRQILFRFVGVKKEMYGLCVRNNLRRTIGRFFTSSLANTQRYIDPVQQASLRERCLLVDKEDNVIGIASKRECHRVRRDGTLPLHRAFSVFLFDHKGDLLLQKRSETKVGVERLFIRNRLNRDANPAFSRSPIRIVTPTRAVAIR